MLSNKFVRLLTSVRSIQNYQSNFLRLLSVTEPISIDKNRETGIVKRFSKEKGYGFISKTKDGTDCFVHFKNINTTGFKALEQGQEVEFTIVQSEKGIEARDVNIINDQTNRMSFMNNSTSSRFGFGNLRRNQSSQFEFGGTKTSKLHSENDESILEEKNSTDENLFSSRRNGFDNVQKRQIGSVKKWSPDRGFGFIRRTNGGPDLFCHVRSLRNGIQALEEGQTVEYRIQRTDKGEEARDVLIFNEDAPSVPPTDPTERHTGTVKRWLSEKGYGFLQRNNGGSDVFVHNRNLTDGITSLEEGQTVEFNITNSEKGEIAENVTIRNEP